jgi:NitT/TauT family transport system permease protein
MTKSQKYSPAFSIPLLYFMVLVCLIEAAVRLFGVPAFLLPAPSSVALEIWQTGPSILTHLLVTMGEALGGFVVGNVCAIGFAILFSNIRSLRQGLYPFIVGLQAVPLVAIAPFITIWFGPGVGGKIAMAALICYFPATVIATNGFSNVNRDGWELLVSMGASRWRIFWSLAVPSAIPGIVSALEVSATLCTIGAIVAELSGASRGIGFLILQASYEFHTAQLFAILVLTALATIALFKAVQFIGGKYAAKYRFSYVGLDK